MTPLVLHDLQDSQIFALAQAAGRAGLVVDGTSEPVEPWARKSRYVRRVHRVPCLSDLTRSMYAWHIKQTGLAGVWLACTDDVADFTARYRGFLEKAGMRLLAPEPEALDAVARRAYPETPGLVAPFSAWMPAGDLLGAKATELPYPLIVKLARGLYRRADGPEELAAFLRELGGEKHPEVEVYVQGFVSGEVARMASAIVLCDADGRAVRVFTARRLRVAPTAYGWFGETLAARAEWLPELAEAACALAEQLGWRGFLEVEAKQGPDGRWHLLEVNPRISGWGALAEADGAGLLRAYHMLCTEAPRLARAALQRDRAEYVRVIATVYHDPDWAVPTAPGDTRLARARRLVATLARAWRAPDRVCLGAWDARDLTASLALAARTVRRVWALFRGRTRLDGVA